MSGTTITVPKGTTQFHTFPGSGDSEVHARVEQDATLVYFVSIWGRSEKLKVVSHLAAPGAQSLVLGVFVGNGNAHAEVDIDTVHEARNTTGNTKFRAVLTDEAKLEFNGMIRIAKGAHGSVDQLDENALLLSPDAYANAVPALEIEADDVRASHAATVGQLDREQLFYLMSRGMPEEDSTRLLVTGFLETVLKELPDKNVYTEAQTAIQQLLSSP